MLGRVPVHMAYSVALMDCSGGHSTIYVSPDKGMEVVDKLISTNHQHVVEWPRHAEVTKSLERERALQKAIDEGGAEAMLRAFMRPPVFQTSYDQGYGTLYAAACYPATASAEMIWPGPRWHQSGADFSEGSRNISFNDEPGNSSHVVKGQGQGGLT